MLVSETEFVDQNFKQAAQQKSSPWFLHFGRSYLIEVPGTGFPSWLTHQQYPVP